MQPFILSCCTILLIASCVAEITKKPPEYASNYTSTPPVTAYFDQFSSNCSSWNVYENRIHSVQSAVTPGNNQMIVLATLWGSCIYPSYQEPFPSCQDNIIFADLRPCGENNECVCCRSLTTGLRVADCSGRAEKQLQYIPTFPEDVQLLDLSRNQLSSQHLDDGFFANATHVTHLFLSNNNLTNLNRSMFKSMVNLTCINVAVNLQLGLDSLKELLAIPGVKRLSAPSCRFLQPSDNFFNDINSTVTTLDIGQNLFNLGYDLRSFNSLPKLQTLIMSLGRLSFITTTVPVYIETLAVDLNNLNVFPMTCSRSVEGRFSLFPKLKTLLLSRNRMGGMAQPVCLPSLEELHLSHNLLITDTFPSFDSKSFPRLIYLELSHQELQSAGEVILTNDTFNNPSLRELDISDNNIPFAKRNKVHSTVFYNCPNLQKVFLDSNNLLHVDEDRFVELFGSLKALRVFSLADCGLQQVSSRMFQNFIHLVKLDLRGNQIPTIPNSTFDALQKIRHLDLKDNKITLVTENTFSEPTRQRLCYLRLSENPFMCTCELRWFRDWYVSSADVFHGVVSAYPEKYACHNLPNTNLSQFFTAEQACVLSPGTSKLLIVINLLLIFTLTLVTSGFRYRWHIRLILYDAFRGRKSDARQHRLQNNNFDFDVFVSYDSENLPWVRQHLMPELEERQGLKLCIHQRDFIPGHNIVDNIAESVESSKKIMMIFSNDFVRSQWCQFELTYCLSHVMDYGDVLLIVCIDDVASREMTTAMMAVLKTTTYIQWADHTDAVQSFWGRLRVALQEVIHVPPIETELHV